MNSERLAAALVILPMVAIVTAIAWFGWLSERVFGAQETVVFDLTGVASAGVFLSECHPLSSLTPRTPHSPLTLV